MRILFRVMITSIAIKVPKQISSIHTAESIPALKEDYIDNIRNFFN
jgi:hypothetical protein